MVIGLGPSGTSNHVYDIWCSNSLKPSFSPILQLQDVVFATSIMAKCIEPLPDDWLGLLCIVPNKVACQSKGVQGECGHF